MDDGKLGALTVTKSALLNLNKTKNVMTSCSRLIFVNPVEISAVRTQSLLIYSLPEHKPSKD